MVSSSQAHSSQKPISSDYAERTTDFFGHALLTKVENDGSMLMLAHVNNQSVGCFGPHHSIIVIKDGNLYNSGFGIQYSGAGQATDNKTVIWKKDFLYNKTAGTRHEFTAALKGFKPVTSGVTNADVILNLDSLNLENSSDAINPSSVTSNS